MPSNPLTPGVYIEEKNAFPNSAIAVATAIPVFIGYTKKAEREQKSILRIPVRISSYAEYLEIFGDGFKPRFTVTPATSVKAGGMEYTIQAVSDTTLYLHSAIRLFFMNGGSDCYILSVGVYGDETTFKIDINHLGETNTNNTTQESVWALLEKLEEPTIVLVPDFIALKKEAYNIYQDILAHCAKTQNRIGIFDLAHQSAEQTTDEVVEDFRIAIGNTALKYGAAYYPWLKTSIFQTKDVTYKNIDHDNLSTFRKILPAGDGAKKQTEGNIIDEIWKNLVTDDNKSLRQGVLPETLHQSLWTASSTYRTILGIIRNKMNEIPPSGAIDRKSVV